MTHACAIDISDDNFQVTIADRLIENVVKKGTTETNIKNNT